MEARGMRSVIDAGPESTLQQHWTATTEPISHLGWRASYSHVEVTVNIRAVDAIEAVVVEVDESQGLSSSATITLSSSTCIGSSGHHQSASIAD
jgi:hypothetical protein